MGKLSKVFIVFLINIIAIGVGLIIAGFVMKLDSEDLIDSFDMAANYKKENSFIISRSFDKVKTDLTNRNIIFKYAPTYTNEVEYYNSEDDKITVQLINNTLVIEQDFDKNWYSFSFLYSNPEVLDIIIYTNQILTLNLKSDIGDISIIGITDDIRIESHTGSVNLHNLFTTKIYISNDTGNVIMDNVEAERIDVTTSTGSINASISASNYMILKTSTGNIAINISISIDDLSYSLMTNIGNIEVNDKKQNKNIIKENPYTCSIIAQTSIGKIRLKTQ